jgi:hypothetical protein
MNRQTDPSLGCAYKGKQDPSDPALLPLFTEVPGSMEFSEVRAGLGVVASCLWWKGMPRREDSGSEERRAGFFFLRKGRR